MKINELIQKTGVQKQTIHYYLQNGLLPKPRKTGPNSAQYSDVHVERIKLIKNLQENFFLPLSVIKKILKKYRRQPEGLSVMKIKSELMRPVESLIGGEIIGEAQFLESTGLRPNRLAQYEAWGLITPSYNGAEKIYSHHDYVIGRVIAEYRNIGMNAERGFEPNVLKTQFDRFRRMVEDMVEFYYDTAFNSMSQEEVNEITEEGIEITALFYYHLYHKLARQTGRETILKNLIKSKERKNG